MAPAHVEQPFEASGPLRLRIGTVLRSIVEGSNGQAMVKGKGWSLPQGPYRARQIVEANTPLLETVLHVLGPELAGEGATTSPREMLLDNLSWNLSLGNPGSSLRRHIKCF
ncbi:MAG: hypothetical protein M1819_001259 [Sarea resinae]|nr:MAG: hypothetical protein M1819_001259 [Sarea resinae]